MKRKGAAYWASVVFACGVALVAHINIGLKFFLILSFLPWCWALLVKRKRLWFAATGVGLALLYTMFISPVVSESRKRGALTGGAFRSELLRRSFTLLPGSEEDRDPIESILTAGRQFYRVDPMGFIVERVANDGFLLGATQTYLAYAFIPRFLWPEKANVSRGAWFTYYAGFSSAEELSTTSTAITAAGELYWNFGLLGVMLGMLALGCVISLLLWRLATAEATRSPLHMLVYLQTILIVSGEDEAGVVLVTAVAYCLIFKIVFFVFERARIRTGGFATPAAKAWS
jgi:hypothetical protein